MASIVLDTEEEVQPSSNESTFRASNWLLRIVRQHAASGTHIMYAENTQPKTANLPLTSQIEKAAIMTPKVSADQVEPV